MSRWFRWASVEGGWSTPFAVVTVTPSTGAAAGGTAVELIGNRFVSGATVTVGGASATSVVWLGKTRITCVTPAGAAGARDVVVTNPNAATATKTGGFTYV